MPDCLPQPMHLGWGDPRLGQPTHARMRSKIGQIRPVTFVVLHPARVETLTSQRMRQVHAPASASTRVGGAPVADVGRADVEVLVAGAGAKATGRAVVVAARERKVVALATPRLKIAASTRLGRSHATSTGNRMKAARRSIASNRYVASGPRRINVEPVR